MLGAHRVRTEREDAHENGAQEQGRREDAHPEGRAAQDPGLLGAVASHLGLERGLPPACSRAKTKPRASSEGHTNIAQLWHGIRPLVSRPALQDNSGLVAEASASAQGLGLATRFDGS